MRIFKTKPFARFAGKALLDDALLCKAMNAANQGQIDADLGGSVIKQRIARQGEGKSGGFRTMVLFKAGELAFFVHGFAKNEKDNITRDELVALRKLASEMLAFSETRITQAVGFGSLIEVNCNEQRVSQPIVGIHP